MKDKVRILAINPGSTSTKIAVYENEERIFDKTMFYSTEELEKHAATLKSQRDYRVGIFEETLKEAGIPLDSFDVIVGRGGGITGRIQAGGYEVTDEMVEYQSTRPGPWHASILGGMIARHFADLSGGKAYIYDAVSVDEMIEVARITGYQGYYRHGGGHVLNQRACALKYAREQGKKLEDLRLIVAHIGGGITFAAFENGKMIDNVSDIEGPMSPERGGALSVDSCLTFFAENGNDEKEIRRLVRGRGGLVAHLGTNDAREVEKMIAGGNKKAELVYNAMIYQIAKSIGGLVVAPMKGKVDAIIVTGSIAYSKYVCEKLTSYIENSAPIVIYPGENELESLAMGGLRMYRGEEKPNTLTADDLNYKYSL